MLILNYSMIPPASTSQELEREKERETETGRNGYPMMTSRGRREGKAGPVSIRDSSLPGISPLQINMNVHRHAHMDKRKQWRGEPGLRHSPFLKSRRADGYIIPSGGVRRWRAA